MSRAYAHLWASNHKILNDHLDYWIETTRREHDATRSERECRAVEEIKAVKDAQIVALNRRLLTCKAELALARSGR